MFRSRRVPTIEAGQPQPNPARAVRIDRAIAACDRHILDDIGMNSGTGRFGDRALWFRVAQESRFVPNAAFSLYD